MSLMIKDKKITFKKYNKIWKEIEKLMKTDFNTKTTYGDDEGNKKGSQKIPEEKVPHKCLSIIILDSIIYAYEKYHPQIFLEECKYMKKDKN